MRCSKTFVLFASIISAQFAAAFDDSALRPVEGEAPKWLSILDRDGNGFLDATEAGRLLGGMDTDKDGRITVAEAIAYGKRREAKPSSGRESTRRWQMIVKARDLQELKKTGDGLWAVSLGHSCVIPAIEPCITIARAAGHEKHTHLMQFYGGASGAAAALATGRIDVLTFGHLVAEDGRTHGGEVADYERWIQLALQHNPETRFYIQDLWPWLPGANRTVNLDEFRLEDYEAAMAVSRKQSMPSWRN